MKWLKSFSVVESGGITCCLYRDSKRILENTFSMCILQDFEALTPNLLARTMETVEAGGLILLLLNSLSSLTSLYTMVMTVVILGCASEVSYRISLQGYRTLQ